MFRLSSFFLLISTTLLHVQTPDGKNVVKLNGHVFTLPKDFEIELVAGTPLVDRPISADFDEQGRLYVSDSSGSNEKVAIQLDKKPHRIVRLEDTDGDGKFDKSVVFADKMMFPEGVLWRNGSLYVAAPPHIWKLTDTKGAGRADQRSVWFDGKTLTGCANDLHGPYFGPDGWIYWCKGAFAQQSYTIHGKPFRTRASHIFRARPDGADIEPVMTGGMDNPVGLTFTPTGEPIVSCTFLQFPGGGKRDGLLHAVYGGIFGKEWDVLYDPNHKWTSPHVMPIMTHLGPAAPCGLRRYESHLFGQEYKDNLFCCLFNLQKVTRHVLVPSGAGYTTKDDDFLVSDNKDFHPTDVLEDADGSLLILDTGGWYKICCPSSQLVKPDVLGAIYRVRKKGMAKLTDPWGKRINWKLLDTPGLCKLLDDPRLFVRRKAIEVLGKGSADAVPVLDRWIRKEAPSIDSKCNAVWALARIDAKDACTELVELAHSRKLDSDVVRTAFQGLVSTPRKQQAAEELRRRFEIVWSKGRLADSEFTRSSIESMGRLGIRGGQPAMMNFLEGPADRTLEHAILYALIHVGDRNAIVEHLKQARPGIRRRCLVILDQMENGAIQPEWVLRDLQADYADLRETAWWIVSRHPEWAVQVSDHLQQRLKNAKLSGKERDDFVRLVAKLARSKAVQIILTERVVDVSMPTEARRLALQAMAQSNLKETPEMWLAALQIALWSKDEDLLREAALTARALRLPKKLDPRFVSTLTAIGATTTYNPTVRLTALAAVPGGFTKVDGPLFAFLQDQLKPDQPAVQRGWAAEVVSKARLDAGQLIALAEGLKSAAPLDLDRLLDAFSQTQNEKVGESLLAALQTPGLRSAMRADAVRTRLAKFGPAVAKRAEPLLQLLNADAGKQKAKLEEMLANMKPGDVRRGQVVFNNPKFSCIACHSIGYVGGKIGPDLTRIGAIRTQRDLLEAIVFPSASFVRSYEPFQVVTRDGKTHNGLIKLDSPTELILITGANQEVRLAREEIEEIHPSSLSIMPAGLDQQLSPQDLADLVAFLQACK